MYNSQEIAKRIKHKAKQNKQSIGEILSYCNLGINTISKMAKGTDILTQNFAKIADYLNCSIDYLLGRTDTTATSHIPDNLQKYLTKNRFSTFIEIEKILIEPEKTNSSKFYCFNTDNIDTLLEIYKLVENYSEYNSYNISLDIDEDGFKNLFKCYKNEISTENYYTMSINDFKNIFKPLYEQYTICYLIELANNLLKDNFKTL